MRTQSIQNDRAELSSPSEASFTLANQNSQEYLRKSNVEEFALPGIIAYLEDENL